MLYDYIGSLLERDYSSERTLYLLGNVEIVEYRSIAFVQFYNTFLLRSDGGNIVLYLGTDSLVIDIDIGETVVQQIPQYGGSLAVLGKKQMRRPGFCQFWP